MDVTPDELARQVVDRIRAQAVEWLAARSVSILLEDPPGALTQHGSAGLLAIADAVFLVSAGHVLRCARNHSLWINPVATGVGMLALEAVEVAITNDQRIVDFAFVRLPETHVETLTPVKTFARIHDVDPDLPSGEWYAVLGYPREGNPFKHTEATVPSRPMYYGTRLHDVAADPLADYDAAINIAMEYPIYGSGDAVTRKLTTLPDVRGMSGAGIWRLFRRGESALGWTNNMIRLAGVLHTRSGDSGPFQARSGEPTLVGVHFAHVIGTIRAAHPDLAPAINLIHPDRVR